MRAGFTLIEMAIVLVIIGLIVGGVLVGQDLMRAAGVRATISQIEKYNQAVNTFIGKYNAMPGDMNAQTATQFGFTPRGASAGQGDGNGVLEGYSTAYGIMGVFEMSGETVVFWVDLSKAGLIEGGFNTATFNTPAYTTITPTSSPSLDGYFPEAKLGNGNYIYVWSGGINVATGSNGVNYYGLSAIASVTSQRQINAPNPVVGLTVAQAYSIDTKVDDGYPQTGRVTAMFLTGGVPYVQWATGRGASYSGAAPGTSALAQVYTCYDNGGNASNIMGYSMSENNGAGVNCALSFRFQ
jgi:prepilin-type N-terminal cleavage/methylation domain-containing protein